MSGVDVWHRFQPVDVAFFDATNGEARLQLCAVLASPDQTKFAIDFFLHLNADNCEVDDYLILNDPRLSLDGDFGLKLARAVELFAIYFQCEEQARFNKGRDWDWSKLTSYNESTQAVTILDE